jgi:RNA polymerase sigma factor (sigma-70 family)
LPVNAFVAVGVSRGMQGVVSTSQPHVDGDVEARVEHDAYAIYERHYREMVGLARLLLGDVATAEDIVHDATIRLHASLQRVRDPDRVVAYYRSIVLNLARNHVRRRGRARAVEHRLRARAGDELIHHDVRRPERAAVLSAVIALPRRQQECVLLRHYSDLDERSIADTLGISVGSVKKHLHRASGRLATTLKEFS